MPRRIVAALLAAAFAAGAPAEPGRTPKPVIEAAAKGSQCVADPAFMRRNHMELLRHQRDDTVHGGKRGGAFSLKGCIECHAGRQTGSVAQAETNFCVSCHSYAAVKIDCFECHSSRPQARGPALPSAPDARQALRVAARERRGSGAGGVR